MIIEDISIKEVFYRLAFDWKRQSRANVNRFFSFSLGNIILLINKCYNISDFSCLASSMYWKTSTDSFFDQQKVNRSFITFRRNANFSFELIFRQVNVSCFISLFMQMKISWTIEGLFSGEKNWSSTICLNTSFKRIFDNRLILSCARSFALNSTIPFILFTCDNTFLLSRSIIIENHFNRMNLDKFFLIVVVVQVNNR